MNLCLTQVTNNNVTNDGNAVDIRFHVASNKTSNALCHACQTVKIMKLNMRKKDKNHKLYFSWYFFVK